MSKKIDATLKKLAASMQSGKTSDPGSNTPVEDLSLRAKTEGRLYPNDLPGDPNCPYCGGALTVVHQLGEALVARTLGEGGAVEVVRHTNKLHSYRSVGAFLRQTGGGMRRQALGQSPPAE